MEQALATIMAELIAQDAHLPHDDQFWEQLPKHAALLLYIAEIEYRSLHLTDVPPEETGS